jgi:predicted enzyme involved in methoxymalonyl-ACP biosynthesis
MDLWLMSCRVLKREMELAMLDVLVEHARNAGIEKIVGYYIPTKKNGMVAGHYESLGFTFRAHEPTGATVWELDLATYTPRSSHINRRLASA